MTRDRWTEWDAARAAGQLPTDIVRGLTDEALADLLLADDGKHAEERRMLVTEALRRTTNQRQALHAETLPREPRLERHRTLVNEAAERIHEAEHAFEQKAHLPRGRDRLDAAHEASLLAEEHRAATEDAIAGRARLRDELRRRANEGLSEDEG